MSINLKYGAFLGLVLVCMSSLAVAQGPADGADVWYTYTPDVADDYILSLTESFAGATVAVFNGDAILNDPAAALPDVHEEYSAPLTLALDAGVPYYFRVAGVDLGGGVFATGAYTILLDAEPVVEGEGEPVEGELVEGEGETSEGEPIEGESDITQDLLDALDLDDDGFLSFEEAQTIIPGLTQEQFVTLDRNKDGVLDVCELGGVSEIKVDQPLANVTCEDFDSAHHTIADAFNSVTTTCADKTISVAMLVARTHKGKPVVYNLDQIAEKIPGFGVYDGTLEK